MEALIINYWNDSGRDQIRKTTAVVWEHIIRKLLRRYQGFKIGPYGGLFQLDGTEESMYTWICI